MEPTENEPTGNEPKTFGQKVVETLDAAIDDAGDLMGGSKVSKIAGGAAIGVVAAVVLPFSILTGAVIGAGYSAWRQSNRPRL